MYQKALKEFAKIVTQSKSRLIWNGWPSNEMAKKKQYDPDEKYYYIMPLLYKSLGWLPLTTVTNQRNIHHFPRFLGEDQYIVYASNICKMCPENITIPGACRELTPFFSMKYTSQWKQDGFDPPRQGFTPPKFTKKNMATNVTECVCVCTTFYSIHPFLPVVCLDPKVMIYCKSNDDFFLTPTLPFLNGAKFHTNAISSPSTLVVPNDEVLRLDWSKGPAGAPWGTPSTWQKEMVSLEGAGWKHQISED